MSQDSIVMFRNIIEALAVLPAETYKKVSQMVYAYAFDREEPADEKIYLYDQYVGLLTEDETGFTFAYDADYLASSQAEAVSLTLPLSNEPYHDTVLFPFFDGLIPEGWLLNIAESSWKINQRDRMSLLLACCKDCIGAVSVIPAEEPPVEETNS